MACFSHSEVFQNPNKAYFEIIIIYVNAMKYIYFFFVMLLLLPGAAFSQSVKTITLYYNDNGDTTNFKNASTRLIKKTAANRSYTLDKYDLKGKHLKAFEAYGPDALPVGTWKIYDTKRKQLRALNFDNAIRYQAQAKENDIKTASEPTIDIASPPSVGSTTAKSLPLSEPVLKPGKYKNFKEYFNAEFYLNEEINNYLNEVQSVSIRVLLTVNPNGKVTHMSFRPNPGPQLTRELTRVFLNSPELVPVGEIGKVPEANAMFLIRLGLE